MLIPWRLDKYSYDREQPSTYNFLLTKKSGMNAQKFVHHTFHSPIFQRSSALKFVHRRPTQSVCVADCYLRGTQREFSENICSEDDLRSRIFGTFVVKFRACLPLLGFSNIWKIGIITHFQRIFTLNRSPRSFGSPFSGWNFRKGKFWSL